jgi:trehalose/maltose hydrolase-like predicted phosphorylase
MFPVLLALFPSLAENIVEYRLARLNASLVRALENGYSGAFWVWEVRGGMGRPACEGKCVCLD